MLLNTDISPLGKLLAARIQPTGGYFSQFICQAYSQGHTAVRYQAGIFYPKVSEVFTIDGRAYLTSEELVHIQSQMDKELQTQQFSHLVQDSVYFTLPVAHATETGIIRELGRLNSLQIASSLDSPQPTLCPNKHQQAAIEGALQANVSAITGGPGTGKTFTAGLLLAKLLHSARKRLHVALLAPTGRAVKNLYASILRFLPNTFVDAKTIHRALYERSSYLPYSIVIVDESSMIDSSLMLQLLSRLHEGTKLVFLGDAHQLPSIDPGQPFFDMVNSKTKHVPSFHLETCVRTENEDLKNLASYIRSHDETRLLFLLHTNSEHISFIDLEQHSYEEVLTLIRTTMFSPWQSVKTLSDALLLTKSTALLCAVRKGPLGSETFNQLGKDASHARFRPVMSTKNTYQLGIMNSDLGIVDSLSSLAHFDDITVPEILCSGLENAYAMTVHKSQGSEFDTVLVVIAPDAVCDPKLLYTAITRAKKKVVLITSIATLQSMLRNRFTRESLLEYNLIKSDIF